MADSGSSQPAAGPSGIVPTSSIFSFKAPLQHRRVSLALPPSDVPKLTQAWDFRDDTAISAQLLLSQSPQLQKASSSSDIINGKRGGKMRRIADDDDDVEREKKPRNKWTMEETEMLVKGCNRHGVGNWKAILRDSEFKFDNRSPVDLKDRFRTYFPDAYKLHYPNAKTHLSSKVRSTLPDGSPLFEKTRSKKRRPFTEEEDRALKAGYEKHGTVWATIAKDPIFQEQNRRSTDLRDRFRNAFPDLYLKAGYKPRNTKKKVVPVRAATDDQVGMSTTSSGLAGPRRKRRNTSQGLLRGGTKSVPQSTAPSEDEDSDDELAPPSADQMDLTTFDFENKDSQSQSWSGLDTPTHSSHQAWSPTSSHMSADHFLTTNPSSHSSPFQSNGLSVMGTMIGNSAWGTNDWFSPNPRLDSSSSNTSLTTNRSSSINSSSLSLLDSMEPPPSLSPTPSSPFSFHALNHGVLDRYDLVPSSFSFGHLGQEFGSASEIGLGDSQSTFSDDFGMHQSTGFRGFTHHSNYAGDLIFGARTHQPQPFSFGLGLSGMQIHDSTTIHPMQLHTSLNGVDELGLTNINLNDAAPSDVMLTQKPEPQSDPQPPDQLALDDLVDLDLSLPEAHATPPGTPILSPPSQRQIRAMRTRSVNLNNGTVRFDTSSIHGRSISVPPGEDRASRPQLGQSSLQCEFDSNKHRVSQAPPSAFSGHFLTPLVRNSALPQQPEPDTSSSNADLCDLPFLDLHYNAHPLSTTEMSITTGQALDLASSTHLQYGTTRHIAAPSAPGQGPVTAESILFGSEPTLSRTCNPAKTIHHHRGQSAFTSQDLIVRSKRKRASWDGGPG